MDKKTDKAINKYITLIKDNYTDVSKAILFGSFAKNSERKHSDIDVALVFKNLDDEKKFDLQVQLMILASKVDTRIEPHPVSESDFNSNNPFVIEIKKTGTEIKI